MLRILEGALYTWYRSNIQDPCCAYMQYAESDHAWVMECGDPSLSIIHDLMF